jgi:DNA-binding NarL/FixJ family response regulator
MPDLVITDISLPATSGANIVAMLKAENPDLKIIAISLYDDADIVKTVLDAGAIGFVIKRTIGEDLVPAVRSVIAGHEFVSPSIKLEVS